MSRLDGGAEEAVDAEDGSTACDGPRAVMLDAREVPLGGVRAMEVRRALPQRDLPMVGAWCFLDRFGPQTTLMRVEPHPHIGLQTVTWPLEGEVHHRDSVGSDVLISRGALNLMTSGAGISHSEYSVTDHPIPLDALQLWVALPESRRHGVPAFEQHATLPRLALDARVGAPAEAVVVMGEFGGIASPASAFTPIVGAEVRVPAGSTVRLPLHPEWEYAIVGVAGDLRVATDTDADAETSVGDMQLLYLGIHRDGVDVRSEGGATLFLIGGEPFEDEIVMWWNFVGRTHEEIVAAREEWEAGADRFGHVLGHGDERVPAPQLPGVRLRRRSRRL